MFPPLVRMRSVCWSCLYTSLRYPDLTLHIVDYADLGIVDLSKAITAEGRAELATVARDALHKIGFFYVVNHGLSQPEVF